MSIPNGKPAKTRYAIVGTGHRSSMFTRAILEDYKEIATLAAFCDTNALRMGYWKEKFGGALDAVECYAPNDFEEMIEKHKVDKVIVCSMDRTHHSYICRAMRAGCDVISEKPMTVDGEKCDEILRAINETGKDLKVTFNYRYSPRHSKVREIIKSGKLGKVLSVHFEWFLDTKHGADYFRRWHRDKNNSGGLMVHKSTHHFDLVNWWIDSRPERVCAMGGLKFYGEENAEERGLTDFYHRGSEGEAAKKDPFGLDLAQDEDFRGLYYNAEERDGYFRDLSVFSSGISIEDDVGVLVSYESKAVMTYHLTAYSPKEGYRVAFNGSKGRLELDVLEAAHAMIAGDDHNRTRNVGGGSRNEIVDEPTTITLQPIWGKAENIEVEEPNTGGHGGGDERMLKDIFVGGGEDPLGRAAGYKEGAYSILAGIAANESLKTGRTVRIDGILKEKI